MLERVAGFLAGVAQWLNQSTLGAAALRIILAALVVGMLALGVALTGVAAVLSVVTALSWASGLGEIIFLVTAAILAITLLGLVIEDLWVRMQGGRSVGEEWDKMIARFVEAHEWMRKLRDLWRSFWVDVKDRVSGVHLNPEIFGSYSGYVPASSKTKSSSAQNNTQTNHVSIKVDGAQDPKATGKEVLRSMKNEIDTAFGSMAADNY